ncbi:hypothetical protein B6N60_00876 [Richelia sinica FACHB-800]|uniref:DUF4363 domain-containing protein n=2 Tax=Richelia TaxID=98443 RepID=A0A975T503_9NOST|nr:DUF4363 domain-containing protein [Richelia sinica FACHB-800]QXE22195.1 hypothetical protein B6N60_00876 [Richelia sinica FACHB-800]
MKRYFQILIIAGISLISLVGCSSGEQTTTQSSPGGNSTAETPAKTTGTTANNATPKTNFDALLGVVNSTTTDVNAGNFTKAKAEFDKFEDFWSKVEDGVKDKSPDAYKKIEDNADEIKAGLKAAKPNKEKLSTALKSLNQNLTTVNKS